MYSLEEVDESNRQQVVESLRKDAVRHVFALYDIQYNLTNTKMYTAFENGVLKGTFSFTWAHPFQA